VVEVLAGIERHRLDPRIAALGAGDSSLGHDLAHGKRVAANPT